MTQLPSTIWLNLLTQTTLPRTKLGNMVATNGAFSQMKILTNKLCGPHNFINSYLLYSWSKTNINLFLPQVKVFLPCSHHNLHLHLHPWPINSNSQAYFHHCLEWALYIFSNLPPSLLTFPRRPGSLSQAVSLLNLIVRCQWENSCLNISISLGCLSLSNFESKQVNVPTPPCKKKTHIDSINRWLPAFAVYGTVLLTSFPL